MIAAGWKPAISIHRDQRRHHAYGTNTRLGAGEWMVVEADVSDGSFRLPAVIATSPTWILSIGSLGIYAGAMVAGYDQFVANIPSTAAVLCIDHRRCSR